MRIEKLNFSTDLLSGFLNKCLFFLLIFFSFSSGIVFTTSCTFGNLDLSTEVLVIGGTTSGTTAGIQCARSGVETIIVEETPWLGGMLTSAGVSATDGNHELPSGIWNEFREKLRIHYGGTHALATGWVSHTQFEPHVGDSIFKAMAASEKMLKIFHGYYLVSVSKTGNKVTSALFENNNGDKLRISAKIVIDATDLGDGLALAGAEYDLGMESRSVTGEPMAPATENEIIQDLTWCATLKDYGPGKDMTIEKPDGYNPEIFKGSCAMTVDSVRIDCHKMLSYARLPNNKYLINWPRHGNDIYLNVVEMSHKQRVEELKKAKLRTLQFIYYIQTGLGFKHLGLADDEFPTNDKLALVAYHREGRRLKGISRLTINHVSGIYNGLPLYRTGISVGDYPVDHHHGCNPDAPEIKFPPVPSFNIPLGSLIPEKTDGLIVSDKAISVSNIINGSTRLQPVVMLTGQAAGALAALCVKQNIQPRQINIRQLQQNLLNAGAYLMPLYDVKPVDSAFQAIQRITSSGILLVKGEPWNWANRTWFYPDSTVSVSELTSGLSNWDKTFAVVNDQTVVTLQKIMEIFSTTYDTDRIKQAFIFTHELNSGKEKTNLLHKTLTKRELSIGLDNLLQPFETKKIGFDGNFLTN